MKLYLYIFSFLILFSCNDDEGIVAINNSSFSIDADSSSFVVPSETLSMLALGDSYTIGASVLKADRWNEQLKVALENKGYSINDIQYIAQTGWTTSNLLSAIDAAELNEKFDIVTLLIGVNNQYQRVNIEVFQKEYEELLDIAINLANGDPSKVIVLSIPDYGYTYTVPSEGISQEINQYNSIKASITGRKNVVFHNITSYTRMVQSNPKLLASDGLHPSGELYKLWVNDIFSTTYEQFLVNQSN